MLNKDNNPWLGLASYEYEDAYRFFGREKELEKLKDCVCNNLITTIYGISGAGKTSLINAGMCPLIEKENYLPVRIRLEHNSPRTYSEQIIKAVSEAIAKCNGEIEANDQIDTIEAVPESEKLWLFFYANSFWSATNHHLYPVVFIDQFEEIFTKNEEEEAIKNFFDSVSALQYDNPPTAITKILENSERHTNLNITQDFRVVLIMREDFLARLEDYAYDSPALRKNRVGIKRMNGNQAIEVITRPMPGLVSRDAAIRIITKVAGREVKDNPAFLERLSVDTSLLSLFCSELYLRAAEQKHETITSELINQFGENILATFYVDTMKLVPQPTADYLESHLLTRSGFRNSVAMEDIEADGIRKEDLDKLSAKRLIRIETLEGTERVEFTHDVLCAIAKEHRDKALEKTNRKQSNSRTFGFIIDLIIPLAVMLPTIFRQYTNSSDDDVFGINPYQTLIPLILVFFTLLFFNSFILFPYRHSKDRNSVFVSLITLFVNGFASILSIATVPNSSRTYPYIIMSISILYYLIQFFNSFRFNRKRSFKEALKYIFRCQIYKDYPEMMTILKAALLIIITFVSFLVGLTMSSLAALIIAPLSALATFLLLYSLLGHTMQTNTKAIVTYTAQIALVAVIIASQFIQHHQLITLTCLSALLALTVIHVLRDEVMIPSMKKIRNMVLLWALAFVFIPVLNSGYNIFNLTEYNRVKNGVMNDYKLTRFLIVEDGHKKQGVRDRWNIVVPVEFDSVDREVDIDFRMEYLSGLLLFDHYYSPRISNDVAFTVYKDGESIRWRCSEHLDMDNIGTTLIFKTRINAAANSSDNLKYFISTNKEVCQPYMIEYAIDQYNKKNDKSNDYSNRYSDKAWFWLFTGDFAQSEKFAIEAVKADSSNVFAYGNLFEAQYLLNKHDEAFKIFDAHKNDSVNEVTFEEAIIKDFEDLVNYKVIEDSVKTKLDTLLKYH